jgi:molybdenum cofactor cytidylyltransferase
MGRAKALLELDGETFLRRVVRSLAEGGCSPVFVVATAGSDDVAAEARRAGAEVLVNPDPGEGPITSLRIALGAIGDTVDGVAYLPVDHPLVRPDTVAKLLDAARSSKAKLTLPMHGPRRGHPAVFHRTLFPALLDPELEGGARAVVHRHLDSARLLYPNDPGVLIDVDTQEAYEAALGAHEAAGAEEGAPREHALDDGRPAEVDR